MLLNLLMSMLLAEMIPILLVVNCFRCVSKGCFACDLTRPGQKPGEFKHVVGRNFGYMLVTFLMHFGYVLVTLFVFWLRFGYEMLHLGYVLVTRRPVPGTFWLRTIWLRFGYENTKLLKRLSFFD